MYAKRLAPAWHCGAPSGTWEPLDRAWSARCRHDWNCAPSGRPEMPRSGPTPLWHCCFPQPESKPSEQAPEAGHRRPQQPGPPSPGLCTWQRAVPAASRGRIGLCRRRVPARAASRGLERPGRPPRQRARRARPAFATGGLTSGPRRHPLAGTPSSAALAPSSPPRAAYLAQAHPGDRGRARPEGQGRGGSRIGGLCLFGGVAVCVGS